MQMSDKGMKLTESSEGCKLRAYQDSGGVWTIGYGHTRGVRENEIIDQGTAEVLLRHDLDYAVSIVNDHAGICSQDQFDALVDFVFNLGPTQFLSSHLLKYHLAGDHEAAANEFPKWKYCKGRVLSGLVTRRAAEAALYIS